jgi:hypothetical protein
VEATVAVAAEMVEEHLAEAAVAEAVVAVEVVAVDRLDVWWCVCNNRSQFNLGG